MSSLVHPPYMALYVNLRLIIEVCIRGKLWKGVSLIILTILYFTSTHTRFNNKSFQSVQ